MQYILFKPIILILFGVTGESCTDPVITPSAYTTSDAVISSESVFIVELSLTCANGAQVGSFSQVAPTSGLKFPNKFVFPQSVTLYADVNGRQFPVTRGQDVGKYQVTRFIWLTLG